MAGTSISASKRTAIRFGVLACVIAVWLIASGAEAKQPPNIVVLFADDLGYGDLGSYGNPYIRTPNLDRLASEGQRWTDFYMAAPVCSPSRGALLTGQLSVRSGLYGRRMGVMHPEDSHGIPKDLVTLAEALKAGGYATGIFGKWHLGDAPDNFPTRNGFDYWYGIPYSNDMDRVGSLGVDAVMAALESGELDGVDEIVAELFESFENPRVENYQVPLFRSQSVDGQFEDQLLERPVDQPTLTRRLTEEAVRFIEENAAQSFLVYLPYSMPHLPVFSSEEFTGSSLRGRYGDAVEEIDWSVGRIRDALERQNIADNTLIVFTSDNGPWQIASTFDAGSAGALHGDKGTTWEGGVRVPAIFWWPGSVTPAVVSDIGSAMDIYATALALAGVTPPDDTDGVDLASVLFGDEAGPRIELPYYHKGHLKAYRKGRYKIVFFGGDRSTTRLAKPQLYDLRQDIGERRDIAEERPDVLAEMIGAAEEHVARVTVAEPIFDMRFATQ